jgi:hypothetical protein
MDAWPRWFWPTCLAAALVAGPVRAVEPVPSGQLLPLAVVDGRCECVLPTQRADDKYFLIVGSLSRGADPFHVNIDTRPTSRPAAFPLASPLADADWAHHIADLHDRTTRARQIRPPVEEFRPVANPPPQRDFWLFVKESDFYNPANYAAITGVLRGVGRHVQVYVDRDQPRLETLQPTVTDIVRTIDEEVYPKAQGMLGRTLDVDRDGRFTVLLTPWLGKLVSGKVSLGGFVRGSDFYRDLAAPYGNRCDMMYLNTNLKPGQHLHTLLAHEYTHAIVFSEHVFGYYLPELPKQDEEGWLNEGLAHLAEDLHGYSWSNLDYRISAFLSAPERYQLVVPDYYTAGLFRSHGHRGATYLFLRWCADRFGPEFAAAMVQTNLSGVTNVEATTRERFSELFRHWSASLLLTGGACDSVVPLQRVDPRKPLAGRLLCGPHFNEVPLSDGHGQLSLSGTSSAYVLLHSPAETGTRLLVTADPAAELQVCLFRLPANSPRLKLRVIPKPNGRQVQLELTAYDGDVTVTGAAWERLVPTDNRPIDTSFRAEATGVDWFGDPHLATGDVRVSKRLELPRDGAVVIKVSARDSEGRPVAAWALVDGK